MIDLAFLGLSTITSEGEVHFLTSTESMTGALFVTFLEKLLSETARKVFLILDLLPAQERVASTFFPEALSYDAKDDVFTWNLLSPRVGVNYDLNPNTRLCSPCRRGCRPR